MFKHVTVDRGRRVLLGAAGALILDVVLLPTAASGQTALNPKMKIGVIGAGHIGGTIGGLWIKAGHPVFFSSRHPEELKDLVARLGSLAQAGTVDQAIAFGDVVFIAVPYGALPQIGKDYGNSLKGKIVLDADNAVASRDGVIADEVERNGIGRHPKSTYPARGWCAPSTRSRIRFLSARRTALPQGSQSPLRAMTKRQFRSQPNWCGMLDLIRWRSANWPTQAGSSGARQDMART